MTHEKEKNDATLDNMFFHNTYRARLNNVLKDQGIHASQIRDGFSAAEDVNFQTDPGIYTMDDVFHTFGVAFKLLHTHYEPDGTHRVMDRRQVPCKPAQSLHLLPNTTCNNINEATKYIRAANTRAHIMLHEQGIDPTAQNRGTLLGLAAYKCTGGMNGSISALPDCRYNENVYEDVYFPFLHQGATLSTIIEACAWRVGSAGPITYLLGHVPVRFGTLNITEDSKGLASLKLGKYDL